MKSGIKKSRQTVHLGFLRLCVLGMIDEIFICDLNSYNDSRIVPDYKITAEHAEILGYDPIQDYIQMESYDEKEALICGLLTKDTSWINVMEKLFPTKKTLLYED
mgnify:CR=1 FL=1